jgi:hypothetical protein
MKSTEILDKIKTFLGEEKIEEQVEETQVEETQLEIRRISRESRVSTS